MSSADGTKGRCPLDSRPSPGRPPLRRAPKGSALWTPLLRCGGDGGTHSVFSSV